MQIYCSFNMLQVNVINGAVNVPLLDDGVKEEETTSPKNTGTRFPQSLTKQSFAAVGSMSRTAKRSHARRAHQRKNPAVRTLRGFGLTNP
jgi:hypothetical protein